MLLTFCSPACIPLLRSSALCAVLNPPFAPQSMLWAVLPDSSPFPAIPARATLRWHRPRCCCCCVCVCVCAPLYLLHLWASGQAATSQPSACLLLPASQRLPFEVSPQHFATLPACCYLLHRACLSRCPPSTAPPAASQCSASAQAQAPAPEGPPQQARDRDREAELGCPPLPPRKPSSSSSSSSSSSCTQQSGEVAAPGGAARAGKWGAGGAAGQTSAAGRRLCGCW